MGRGGFQGGDLFAYIRWGVVPAYAVRIVDALPRPIHSFEGGFLLLLFYNCQCLVSLAFYSNNRFLLDFAPPLAECLYFHCSTSHPNLVSLLDTCVVGHPSSAASLVSTFSSYQLGGIVLDSQMYLRGYAIVVLMWGWGGLLPCRIQV